MKMKRWAVLVLSLVILTALMPSLQTYALAEKPIQSNLMTNKLIDLFGEANEGLGIKKISIARFTEPKISLQISLNRQNAKVGQRVTAAWKISRGLPLLTNHAYWDYYNQEKQHVPNSWQKQNIFGIMGALQHKARMGGWLNFYVIIEDKYGDAYMKQLWIPVDGWLDENPIRTPDKGWAYYRNGSRVKGWFKDGNTWFFMNNKGFMQTGWVKNGYNWYYFASSGAMQTGWVKDGGNWYYLASSGAMQTGWVKDGGNWYYMRSSGIMETGWHQEGSVWYYLFSNGIMATGKQYINGRYNYFSSAGVWLGY